MNPLLDIRIESRAHFVRMSEYAANNGGMDVCINHCEAKHLSHKGAYGDKTYNSKAPEYQEARCCSVCSASYLTLEQQALAKKELNIVASKTGYWEAGKGCRLPRTHRPYMCLAYHCHTMEKKAPQATAILRFYHPNSPDRIKWPVS